MSWAATWTPRAEADLLTMHYEAARAIYAAVDVWVEGAAGFAELVEEDRIRVIAPGAGCAILAATLTGFRVLRAVPDQPIPHVAPLLDEPEDGEDD
jgi:hypothetical protein